MWKPVSVIPGNSEAPDGPSPGTVLLTGQRGAKQADRSCPSPTLAGPFGDCLSPVFLSEPTTQKNVLAADGPAHLRAEPRQVLLAPAPPGRGRSPQMASSPGRSWGRLLEASPAGCVSGSGADRPGTHAGQACCGQGGREAPAVSA